jgi:hypothetical protein
MFPYPNWVDAGVPQMDRAPAINHIGNACAAASEAGANA